MGIKTRNSSPSVIGPAIKRALSPYPSLFFPLYRIFGPNDLKPMLVSKFTKIVIEGFPRSANTFAFFAFQIAQNKPVSLAHERSIGHHIHSEAQILEGVRRSIPVITLIRNPADTIKSKKLAFPTLDENIELKQWLSFYRNVGKVSDSVVIADFPVVTQEFGEIIKQVNTKYSSSFGVFKHTPENLKKVNSYIDEASELSKSMLGSPDTLLARPTDEKKCKSLNMHFNFNKDVMSEALALYSELTK